MAYVAVNKDGTEIIGEELVRAKQYRGCIYCDGTRSKSLEHNERKSYYDMWANPILDECGYDYNAAIVLPKGTIFKLIGKELTWMDEPVEL